MCTNVNINIRLLYVHSCILLMGFSLPLGFVVFVDTT